MTSGFSCNARQAGCLTLPQNTLPPPLEWTARRRMNRNYGGLSPNRISSASIICTVGFPFQISNPRTSSAPSKWGMPSFNMAGDPSCNLAGLTQAASLSKGGSRRMDHRSVSVAIVAGNRSNQLCLSGIVRQFSASLAGISRLLTARKASFLPCRDTPQVRAMLSAHHRQFSSDPQPQPPSSCRAPGISQPNLSTSPESRQRPWRQSR